MASQDAAPVKVKVGNYRWVICALLFFAGTPLLLGSWYGLAVTPVLVIVLAARAMMEERTLAEELPGYREYAQRVRYRLIPGGW